MQIEVPNGWQQTEMSRLVSPTDERRTESSATPLYSLTIERGVTPKSERYDRSFLVKSDNKKYKLIRPGNLVFNPANLRWGAIAVSKTNGPVLLSPIYEVFKVSGETTVGYVEALSRADFMMQAYNRVAEGTLVERTAVKTDDFLRLPVLLPPLPEQRKIAAILSSVDEAIAATEQVIEQTRRVKEGLLQELLTRGIGHTRFKQTPIGEIPESWEVKRLGDVIKNGVRNGYSPVSPAEPTGKWVLGLGALSLEGFVLSEIKPAPLNESKVDDFLLEPGDFLMSRSNTPDRVGICAIYRGGLTNCAYPDLMMRFHCDVNRIHPDFLEHWLRGWTARKYIKGAAAGTSQTMVKINSKTVHKTPVLLPPMEEQRQIVLVLSAIDKAIDHGKQRTSRLRQTKAGLLQDLLTGKVRVSV